jgi:hypothetical protein
VTALAHHVRIGRTDHDVYTVAICADCQWLSGSIIDGPHVRELAVAHAQLQGHEVRMAETVRTRTVIQGWGPRMRLRASDGGVCGNDERPVCTEAHLGQVTS